MYEAWKLNGPTETLWVIHKDGTLRIDSFLYATREEAQAQCDEANALHKVQRHWPKADEEDVQRLLTDYDFYPMVDTPDAKEASPMWRIHKACERIARQRAREEDDGSNT